MSPFTPGYVADRHQIELLAERRGRVLLLFEVGIEVDLGHLRREHGGLLWASPLQIGITTAVATRVLLALGLPPFGAALVGLSVAMSSSVVVVNITRSRRRTTDKPTEEGLLGWSVLQDVTGVALGTVIIATSGTDGRPLPVALALLAAYVVLAVVAAQVLPIVLRHLRSEHDLFLIVSVASGLALAAAGAVWFGVPAALAAFVGGLAISNRAETAEARRRLLPFRDVFAVLFFVAVGTLIDPSALPGAVPEIALLVAMVVVAKVAAGLGAGADRPARRPARAARRRARADGRVRLRAGGDRPRGRRRDRRDVHGGAVDDRGDDRRLGGPRPVLREGPDARGAPGLRSRDPVSGQAPPVGEG